MRIVAAILLSFAMPLVGAEPERVDESTIRSAVELGLPVVTEAALRYPDHRRCFSCHHQTLPLFTVKVVREAGVQVETSFDEAVLEFTNAFFRGKRNQLAEGKHIGGRAATVAYGLWAFDVAGVEPDETTAAVVEYLLRHQGGDGTWHPPSKQRPPLAESPITLAVLAVEGFEPFATEEQAERVQAATERVRKLLTTYEPRTHEDFVFRLWGRWSLGFDDPEIESARRELLARQRDDGGFAQTDDLESDAYSTGQALYVLRYTGSERTNGALQRMTRYLLATQSKEESSLGSWHVKSRAKPVQVYFDNGDPHGKDQFISTPATAWAVAGLATILPAWSDGGTGGEQEVDTERSGDASR